MPTSWVECFLPGQKCVCPEQIASLRAIPGLIVLRPGDANEVSEAYRIAMLQTHHPVILALSRQAVPTYDRTKYGAVSGVAKGGYIFGDAAGGKPDVILVATGTELMLAVEAYEKLTAEGVKARVVSLPSWELFEMQPQAYRDSVLPPAVTARVCVEMLSTFGWGDRSVQDHDRPVADGRTHD